MSEVDAVQGKRSRVLARSCCTGLERCVPEQAAAENEPQARLESSGATGSGEARVSACGSTSTSSASNSVGVGSVGGTHSAEETPQFYIEVDASAMVNLKAGTQYTLVPVTSDGVTAAAVNSIPAAEVPPQQPLSWERTTEGQIPEEDPSGSPREVVSKEEMPGESFGLEQGMINGFDPATIAPTKTEEPDARSPLETDFENGGKMTYTPLMTVPQQEHQQEQQQQQQQSPETQPSHEAAAAASHMSWKKSLVKRAATRSTRCARACPQQHNTSGYDEMRYRHPSSPMYVAPPQHGMQHQTPFLVHSRAAWAPFPGTSNAQAAFMSLPQAATTVAAGGSSSGISAGTSNGGPAGADGMHATLAGDDGPSTGDFGRGGASDAGASDLMGVARVANMGQIQHMVGPLDSVPYYMPFNGRENHNEKERKRRTRIKNACQTLRSLVPGLSEKTDKATVFEFTVQYLLHLRRHLGAKHDKTISQEFMEKYSPY